MGSWSFNNNNRKLKAIGNITLITDHYSKNRLMGDNDTQSSMPY